MEINLITKVDLKEIRSLIDLMKKNGIAVFKLEKENFKITLKTNEAGQPILQGYSPMAAPVPAPTPTAAPLSTTEAPPAAPAPSGPEVKSPMVGTYYASPSPDSPPFITVGQQITPDSVVCIVEAMKVMNEVKAEVSGTVAEICTENGKPVQFGQTLFRLK